MIRPENGDSFSIEWLGDSAVVRVVGEVDLASVRQLEDAIAAAESSSAARVVLSLERCRYCDSTCVSLVLRAWHRIGARFFVVISPDTNVWRIFDITGVIKQPFVVTKLDDALKPLIVNEG